MKRVLHIIAGFLAVATTASAQSDDLGLWLGVSAEKKINKKWSAEVEAEYRMKDNISATDRFSIGLSATYKATKWLKASAGYDYLHSREEGGLSSSEAYYNSSYWYPRHRVYAGITGAVKVKRFHISLRERWVYTYRPSFDRHRMDMRQDLDSYGLVTSKTKGGKAENVLRSKLTVEYNIKKCPVTPYASIEAYNSWSTEKLRYAAGAEYKINKHNSIKLYYLYQDRQPSSSDDIAIDQHVIGTSYNVSF